MVRCRVAPSAELARIEVASRTDAGVSARANALALTSHLPKDAIVRTMNGIAPEIFFEAIREVEPGFRARAALWREYRYFLPGDPRRARELSRAARLFGREVDVRSFGRGFPADPPAVRPIDEIRVGFDGRGVRIDVRARSFVWGMVRKMIAALLAWESGDLTAEEIRLGVQGERRLSLGLAPADGLVLWEVRYRGPWPPAGREPGRRPAERHAERLRRASTRVRVIRALAGRPP